MVPRFSSGYGNKNSVENLTFLGSVLYCLSLGFDLCMIEVPLFNLIFVPISISENPFHLFSPSYGVLFDDLFSFDAVICFGKILLFSSFFFLWSFCASKSRLGFCRHNFSSKTFSPFFYFITLSSYSWVFFFSPIFLVNLAGSWNFLHSREIISRSDLRLSKVLENHLRLQKSWKIISSISDEICVLLIELYKLSINSLELKN